jgi:anaphase-promoting complex subunit 6
MAAYRTSLRLFTGSHLPLLYMGMEYLRNNNIMQAQRQFEQAQAICGTDPLVLNEIGVALYREKKYEEAATVLANGLALAQEQRDDNPETWEPTMFNLAHAYRKLGDYDSAVMYYEQCLSICPAKASTYTALGFTRHLQGDYDQAIDCYHKALGLDSEDLFATQMLQKALADRVTME